MILEAPGRTGMMQVDIAGEIRSHYSISTSRHIDNHRTQLIEYATIEGSQQTDDYRASHRVPSHWALSALRGQPHAQAVPHAHFRAQHSCRQVALLVLLDQVEKGQEGQR